MLLPLEAGVTGTGVSAQAVRLAPLGHPALARRRQRVAVSRLMREAEEWAPLDELFATARHEASSEGLS